MNQERALLLVGIRGIFGTLAFGVNGNSIKRSSQQHVHASGDASSVCFTGRNTI